MEPSGCAFRTMASVSESPRLLPSRAHMGWQACERGSRWQAGSSKSRAHLEGAPGFRPRSPFPRPRRPPPKRPTRAGGPGGAHESRELMPKIKVLLADDHTLFRQGIRNLLAAETDLEVVAEVSNAGDAMEKTAELRPDVVLMDIGMPGFSSFEATRHIRRERPDTKVLFLTMYDDEDYLVEG